MPTVFPTTVSLCLNFLLSQLVSGVDYRLKQLPAVRDIKESHMTVAFLIL